MEESEDKSRDVVNIKSLKNIDAPQKKKHTKQIDIKEIDSWVFTFSQEDNCIYLGTPALKAFNLRLTVDDLEELLESVYRATGTQKTIRKLRLSVESLTELIEEVNRFIEEKRSKVTIKFDKGELQRIAELINKKLDE
jgi:hypothetical protein